MVRTWAVTNPDPGDARNDTALAISSGRPVRPTIVRSLIIPNARLELLFAMSSTRHLGHDPAWRHCVDRDPAPAQFHRKAARQDQHLGLGCCIERRGG